MMQEAKSVHLNYDNFNLNAANILRDLGEKSEFADVTLVAEDQQIEAHKFVLSSSSPFFKNLFHRNPHPHPMIYLKGVSFDNLQTILKFLYEGQAMVEVDNLKLLLEMAGELQIKCLTNLQEECLERCNEDVIKVAALKSDDTMGFNITEATAENCFTFDDSEIEKDDLKHLIKKKKVKKVDDNSLACNQCDFISSSKPNLWRHNKSIHVKEIFSCDQCGSISKRKDHLKQHILSAHEGKRYSCDNDQCDYTASYPQMIATHRKKMHLFCKL